MGLPLKLDSLDDLPEAFKGAYVPAEGGGFELDYAAIKDHPGVAKVRSTADDLDRKRKDSDKALKELADRYGDLDPKAARDAMKALEEQGDKKLIDDGQIEELLEKRVERMRAEFDSQLAAKDKALSDAEAALGIRDNELSDIKIYDTIKDAALGKGARKEALQDISNRAREMWKLRDGKPVALDGENVIMGTRGEALTIAEWVEGLAKEADYLFEPNSGGGAGGGDRGGDSFSGAGQISSAQSGDFISDIADGKKVVARN